MKSKNINNFYSGGYQYDVLDRFAQKELLKTSKEKYLFTKFGFIKHKRKLFYKSNNCKVDFVYKIKNKYLIKVSLYEHEYSNIKPVATAIFLFVGKNNLTRRKHY